MEKWVHALGDLCGDRIASGHVLTISAHQQNTYFRPAAQLAKQGVRASRLLSDEAEALVVLLQAGCEVPLEPPRGGWFVRTSACSPKDAECDGGAGPHHSLAEVVFALLASDRVHRSLKSYDKNEFVYLMPFDNAVSIGRELRVFVHEANVTAVSQYDLFNPSPIFAHMDDLQLSEVAYRVTSFHQDLLRPRWQAIGGIASYIMDVEYISDEPARVRLIELNSFGAEMAAGSALFHWVRDSHALYSSDNVCIRVLSDK